MAEAQAWVLEAVGMLAAETVGTAEALGRILDEPVRSERTLPPDDNSAMDGYAARRADLADRAEGAGRGGSPEVALRVAFDVPAGGRAPRRLEPGEAARILTGAPLPDGADCVVRQEDAERDGDRVVFTVAPKPGENVRRAGEDVRHGELVIGPGTRLGPAHLGMLASLGRSVVAVRARPRVAILSGGDELVEPDRDVSGGRIVSSNSYTLAAQCREVGAEPSYLGIARDQPEDIERRLRAGLRSDVLVSSAGVSVGDHDHVRPVLESLGARLEFWGVRMKPGYPFVFGRFESGPLVFGLPGSPVSAMVTFEQFVRPALLKLGGHRRWFRPLVETRLAEPLEKKAGRLHFVRVGLERNGNTIDALPHGNQSSGVLRSMTLALGLLIFPAEATRLDRGARARVQVLDPDFLVSDASGVSAGEPGSA